MIVKYLAVVLVTALLVVGAICSFFIATGMTVEVKSNVEVNVGAIGESEAVLHYNIIKKGTLGV
jgi:hypothetical protein